MATRPPNKELKLTKPSQDGASQLNSVLGRPFRCEADVTRDLDTAVEARVARHYCAEAVSRRAWGLVFVGGGVLVGNVAMQWLRGRAVPWAMLGANLGVWVVMSFLGWMIMRSRAKRALGSEATRALRHSHACPTCGAIVLSFERECIACRRSIPWSSSARIDSWMPTLLVLAAVMCCMIALGLAN